MQIVRQTLRLATAGMRPFVLGLLFISVDKLASFLLLFLPLLFCAWLSFLRLFFCCPVTTEVPFQCFQLVYFLKKKIGKKDYTQLAENYSCVGRSSYHPISLDHTAWKCPVDSSTTTQSLSTRQAAMPIFQLHVPSPHTTWSLSQSLTWPLTPTLHISFLHLQVGSAASQRAAEQHDKLVPRSASLIATGLGTTFLFVLCSCNCVWPITIGLVTASPADLNNTSVLFLLLRVWNLNSDLEPLEAVWTHKKNTKPLHIGIKTTITHHKL